MKKSSANHTSMLVETLKMSGEIRDQQLSPFFFERTNNTGRIDIVKKSHKVVALHFNNTTSTTVGDLIYGGHHSRNRHRQMPPTTCLLKYRACSASPCHLIHLVMSNVWQHDIWGSMSPLIPLWHSISWSF